MANFRDGNLEQGQALPALTKTVLLVADNTAIDPETFRYIQVGSDSVTASARTFTINPSTLGVGHELVLYWNTGASTTGELADSGSMKLLQAWTPVQYDTLSLIFDGTNWNEVARGTSTGATARTLTGTHIWVGNSSNVETDTNMTGDITIGNTGVTAIGAAKVLTAMLAGHVHTANGLSFIPKLAIASYTTAVGVTKSTTYSLSVTIPDKAVIFGVVTEVLTAPTSTSSDGSIKLVLPTDGDLTAAITADGAGVSVNTFATTVPLKATAARALSVTLGSAHDITTGSIRYWVLYFTPAT